MNQKTKRLGIPRDSIGSETALGGQMQRRSDARPKGHVVIYGAGSSDSQLVVAMEASHESKIVGFLDDDRSLYNTHVNGLRVYTPQRFANLIERRAISDVFSHCPRPRASAATKS